VRPRERFFGRWDRQLELASFKRGRVTHTPSLSVLGGRGKKCPAECWGRKDCGIAARAAETRRRKKKKRSLHTLNVLF